MGLWVYGTCGRLCGLLFVTHTPCGDWTAVSMGHLGCCVGGSRQPTPCGVRIMGVVGHVGDCVGNLRYPTHARGALFGAYGKFVGVWVTSRDPAGVIKNYFSLVMLTRTEKAQTVLSSLIRILCVVMNNE